MVELFDFYEVCAIDANIDSYKCSFIRKRFFSKNEAEKYFNSGIINDRKFFIQSKTLILRRSTGKDDLIKSVSYI